MPQLNDPQTASRAVPAPRAVPAAEERSGLALRDTQALFARIEADVVAAAATRTAFEHGGLPALAAEGAIAAELRDGELLHAVRADALLNRQDGGLPGYAGTLYLTSRRLVHIGQTTFSVALNALSEISVAGERLLMLALAGGEGISIEVTGPRLLRVEIGRARHSAQS